MSKDKNTITKFRSYLSLEDEEAFINRMGEQGWKLIAVYIGAFFKFEKCEKGEYTCRAVFALKAEQEFIKEFMIDSGAEIVHVDVTQIDYVLYAVRKNELGEFVINNSLDAKLNEYKTKIKIHAIMAAILICFGFICMIIAYSSYTAAVLEFILAFLAAFPIPKYISMISKLKKEREVAE